MTDTHSPPTLAGIHRASVTRRALLSAMEREVRKRGVGGQMDLAARLGVPPGDVGHALRRRGPAIDRVAAALGYRPHAWAEDLYVRVDQTPDDGVST